MKYIVLRDCHFSPLKFECKSLMSGARLVVSVCSLLILLWTLLKGANSSRDEWAGCNLPGALNLTSCVIYLIAQTWNLGKQDSRETSEKTNLWWFTGLYMRHQDSWRPLCLFLYEGIIMVVKWNRLPKEKNIPYILPPKLLLSPQLIVGKLLTQCIQF